MRHLAVYATARRHRLNQLVIRLATQSRSAAHWLSVSHLCADWEVSFATLCGSFAALPDADDGRYHERYHESTISGSPLRPVFNSYDGPRISMGRRRR